MAERMSIEGTADHAVQQLLTQLEERSVRQCRRCGVDLIPSKYTPGRWRERGNSMTSGFDGHKHRPRKGDDQVKSLIEQMDELHPEQMAQARAEVDAEVAAEREMLRPTWETHPEAERYREAAG